MPSCCTDDGSVSNHIKIMIFSRPIIHKKGYKEGQNNAELVFPKYSSFPNTDIEKRKQKTK